MVKSVVPPEGQPLFLPIGNKVGGVNTIVKIEDDGAKINDIFGLSGGSGGELSGREKLSFFLSRQYLEPVEPGSKRGKAIGSRFGGCVGYRVKDAVSEVHFNVRSYHLIPLVIQER
jgi:hypothetical protein